MNEPIIFSVGNQHVEGCGTPPTIDDSLENVVFRSYFENEYGEQWILLYDSSTDEVRVYSGDCGWESELRVTTLKESLDSLPKTIADTLLDQANSLGSLQAPVVTGDEGPVILGKAEQMWIAACLEVVAARRATKPST